MLACGGDVALTTRGYDFDGGELGVHVANGRARFTAVAAAAPVGGKDGPVDRVP